MAVFMNAKGTQNSTFQIGKRGNKIFGSTVTPTASECSTGDLWFDVSNNETKIASKSGDTVTWNKIITENFGDVTISGNLTVCLLYTSPSPRDATLSRMPSSA